MICRTFWIKSIIIQPCDGREPCYLDKPGGHITRPDAEKVLQNLTCVLNQTVGFKGGCYGLGSAAHGRTLVQEHRFQYKEDPEAVRGQCTA